MISNIQAFNSRPNVIIVITDDQGKGDLGCYGNEVIKTPNLDAFYKDAVRLDNFHVSTTCAPSRGALMTGRHTNRLNVFHTVAGRSILFEEETTMPQILAMNGYTTGMFGKWHLGDNYPYRPEDRGFQHVVRLGGGGITQAPDYWGNDYFDDTYWTYEPGWKKSVTKKYDGYCTDVFFGEAIEFIESQKDQPFFCYISTNAPHGPLNVPREYLDMYSDEERLVENQKRFYGMITNIDDNFKRLEDKLDELGLRENTILLFMTDNGTAAGRPQIVNGKQLGYNAGLRGYKGSQYEGGHRVPCMIQWPDGGITGGKDVEKLTAHYDLFPTFIDLLNLRTKRTIEFDGKSIVPLLKGEDQDWADRVLYMDTQRLQNLVKGRKYTVMSERYRLVDGKELYDIKADLGQTKNVISEHAEIADMLAREYHRWWNSLGAKQLNSRYAYIKVGSPYENPTRISSHDLMTGHISQMWHQHGAINAIRSFGIYKIEVVEDSNYKISLRRFPRESNLGFNDRFEAREDKIETEDEMPASNNVGFKEAYLYVADFEKKTIIKEGSQEVDFQMFLPEGKYDLDAKLYDSVQRAYPAYYVYIEKIGK